jgi:hypothetical protein
MLLSSEYGRSGASNGSIECTMQSTVAAMNIQPSTRVDSIVYPLSQLTQGTVFTCAVAEEYEGCATYGLIITARCDVEQDKVRAYNYLPVVPLKDWLARDGKLIIAERLMADAQSRLKNALKENGYSPNILETESPRNVLETLFPAKSSSKENKARDRFMKSCDLYDLATLGLSTIPDERACSRMATANPGLRDAVVKELVHHKLNGYYFLDRVEPNGVNAGHVALLREIRLIPRRVAKAVTEGIDVQQYKALCASEPRCQTSVNVPTGGFSMPVGLIASPFLEHLMQSFAMLFGRIGLPDPDLGYVSGLWERQGI